MTPILCDADKDDLGLDIEHFEKLCKEHRPALAILVHVLGHSNKMGQILQICKKYDILLIEDTCEAYGSELDGKKLGTFGLASTHSFFYGHAMSTIEGGMVTTNDRELYNIMLSLRSHGWLRDNDSDYREETFNKYNMDDDFLANYYFVFPGLNIRNTDLSAYIGRNQLKKIDTFVANRSNNYNRFIDKLKNHVWVQRSDADPVSSLAFGIIHKNRVKIAEELANNSVECRPLICGSIQEHPFWYTRYEKVYLPNATKVHKEGLYVPCHQNLSNEQVDFISNIILDNV